MFNLKDNKMTDKVFYSYKQLKKLFNEIMLQVLRDKWVPDYVVGLNRGGLFPGVWASHHLQVPHHSLNVCLRDFKNHESNCWMAEDAFGYEGVEGYKENAKNILIFDDINDTGSTFKWIKNDWQSICMPNSDRWKDVWGENVRTAVLIDNLSSEWKVDYCGAEINKAEDPSWVVFEWEEM